MVDEQFLVLVTAIFMAVALWYSFGDLREGDSCRFLEIFIEEFAELFAIFQRNVVGIFLHNKYKVLPDALASQGFRDRAYRKIIRIFEQGQNKLETKIGSENNRRNESDYICCENRMLPATRTNSCWRMEIGTSWRCGMILRSDWVHAINISYESAHNRQDEIVRDRYVEE